MLLNRLIAHITVPSDGVEASDLPKSIPWADEIFLDTSLIHSEALPYIDGILERFRLPLSVSCDFESAEGCMETLARGASRIALAPEQLGNSELMASLGKNIDQSQVIGLLNVCRRSGSWYVLAQHSSRMTRSEALRFAEQNQHQVSEWVYISRDKSLPFSPDLSLAQCLGEDSSRPSLLGAPEMSPEQGIRAIKLGIKGLVIPGDGTFDGTAFKALMDRSLLAHRP